MACGILVPRPGIEPGPSAVKAWSPNHWTARELPYFLFLMHEKKLSGKILIRKIIHVEEEKRV